MNTTTVWIEVTAAEKADVLRSIENAELALWVCAFGLVVGGFALWVMAWRRRT